MKELQPHQQRVVCESEELQEKITKLENFVSTNPAYQKMQTDDRVLLSAQLAAMTAYNRILQARIMKF
ncbi:crAss001_48 related protein [Citrobacter sp. Marseille-Q6884]|uniref:crAss001_48 related protein n=1 Tax=Citrobacter sp. Marseille-Q6884 TaxID=2956786 RepID=UPI0021B1A5B3|nr:hypothetical protein [Citrobacter sp. Marseille-Q6884]